MRDGHSFLIVAVMGLSAIALGGCNSDDYTMRSLLISPGAGNAQAANTVMQTVTPWPRYSGDTNIPGNGAQAARAIKEYENGTRETETAKRSLQGTPGSSSQIQITNNNGGTSPSSQ